MGYQNLIGMIEANKEYANGNLDTVLEWHLSANHYPPVHPVFLPIAKRAIDLAKSGNFKEEILMPNGITKNVRGIIEGLHLEAFLEQRL